MAYVHRLYEYDYETGRIKLKNRRCPRCSSIMAHHMKPVERWHCGKCGYTIFVRKGRR
ncbi:MAG: 30S ribosomal protein S27ae [Thermoprotei archaeon]|nr:MAG: 30S ribosomal protein S27ae [Thermoprotei archaeon]